jgi:hypothetical protein
MAIEERREGEGSAILIETAWCAVATKHDPPKRCIAVVFRHGGTRSVASPLRNRSK